MPLESRWRMRRFPPTVAQIASHRHWQNDTELKSMESMTWATSGHSLKLDKLTRP